MSGPTDSSYWCWCAGHHPSKASPIDLSIVYGVMKTVTPASLAQVTHQSGVHPELLAQHPLLQDPTTFPTQALQNEQGRFCLADLWNYPMEAMK